MTARDDRGGVSPFDQLAQLIGDTIEPADDDGGGFDGGDFADVPAPTHWPSLPSVDAAAEWAQLRGWVGSLQARFAHLDHHVIPRCWWRHNDHVEALAALRDHEASSFGPTAPATALVDWFRALRDITALLKAWTADTGCGATHTDPPTPLPATNSDSDSGWARFVTADIARRADTEIHRSAESPPDQ